MFRPHAFLAVIMVNRHTSRLARLAYPQPGAAISAEALLHFSIGQFPCMHDPPAKPDEQGRTVCIYKQGINAFEDE